jgi:DNA-binding MarR family transcriptional regulator
MKDFRVIPLEHNIQLLETIEQTPKVTQLDLAAQLGVAVGTVNWYLKRLIAKGYVRVTRMQRKRLLYLITPRGIAEKSRLGARYMRASLGVYRETRAQSLQLLEQVRAAGHAQVVIEGDGDLAEICRLTCLEQGMPVVKSPRVPVLRVDGARIKLVWAEKKVG